MVSVDVATADVTFGVALTLANAAVAALNAKAFDGTRDLRDAAAALGAVVTKGSKSCTDRIRIVRRVPDEGVRRYGDGYGYNIQRNLTWEA